MSTPVKALSDEWVEALATASAEASSVHTIDAVIEFTRGKTTKAIMQLIQGRVVGVAEQDAEAVLSVPVTSSQLEAFVTGAESMSRAYTRGDFKPVGSTGALVAVLALFDDVAVRDSLTAAMELA